jgi:hypothetical protein
MEQNKNNLMGLTSLVCGIVGFFIFGIILGIIAIITGILSIETRLGKIGLVIGIIDIVGLLILIS